MTTEPTYTDAQIEVVAAKLADGISIEHGRPSPLKMGADMLRSLLSERQAAMHGQGGVTDEMVAAYVGAVNEYLGNMTEDEWQADRLDKHAHLARVARIGLTAAIAQEKQS